MNQTGPPRGREADSADEAAWRQHLATYPWVRGAISLDAFARCWVQEDGLLGAVGAVLPADKQDAFGRLRDAWRTRNLRVFEESMQAISRQLAALATDREPVDTTTFKDQARRWIASVVRGDDKPDPRTERSMNALAARLDRSVRETTDRLIALHGLSGRAMAEILGRVAGQFETSQRADVATTSIIGGLLSGALGGLAADLAAGGITFGAGALIGGILGAIGAGERPRPTTCPSATIRERSAGRRPSSRSASKPPCCGTWPWLISVAAAATGCRASTRRTGHPSSAMSSPIESSP